MKKAAIKKKSWSYRQVNKPLFFKTPKQDYEMPKDGCSFIRALLLGTIWYLTTLSLVILSAVNAVLFSVFIGYEAFYSYARGTVREDLFDIATRAVESSIDYVLDTFVLPWEEALNYFVDSGNIFLEVIGYAVATFVYMTIILSGVASWLVAQIVGLLLLASPILLVIVAVSYLISKVHQWYLEDKLNKFTAVTWSVQAFTKVQESRQLRKEAKYFTSKEPSKFCPLIEYKD